MNDPHKIIDETPMSLLQILAVSMCIALLALDGFDVLSIAFAAPGIASDWGINRAELGIVLSMELIGMGVGSITLGPIADKYGRRPIILLCLAVTAMGMFFTAQAQAMTDLLIHRFYTGLGIGGVLAAVNAMTAEFSNRRNRNMCVMLMAAGYPLGVTIGGSIASYLLIDNSWRAIFYFGAVATALSVPLTWFLMPESVGFLSTKGGPNALHRINQTLRRMGKQTIDALPEKAEQARTSLMELFTPKLLSITLVLTAAYFLHIMTLYFILKWIPKIVFDMGFEASMAGTVLVSANIGGLAGSVLLSLLSHRFPVRNMLFGVLGISFIMVTLFGLGYDSLQQLALMAAATGFFVNAGVVGLYALFAESFPTNVRAGGTGFVIGVGRAGAALSPVVAGYLFFLGYGLQTVAVSMGLCSLLAAGALVFLKTTKEQANEPIKAEAV